MKECGQNTLYKVLKAFSKIVYIEKTAAKSAFSLGSYAVLTNHSSQRWVASAFYDAHCSEKALVPEV